ncbi:hypothetical protein GCK72_010863 [Caenorhabditis remanei]|uniref:ZP domain-containing protein n=1 Tax=Caenorhabditis remanei TaxID=31234 RepID=A0A6A5H6T4_CAERE|nr:hypothetical protein GCK72_010863 [Caenorhabditis remanei]KAF1762601.1 hypothetical protein GCK72_010863 [Caenorhabditis remanei]
MPSPSFITHPRNPLFLLVFITVSSIFSSSPHISVEAKTFENRIVGKPFVSCRPEGVSLVAQTEDFFEGQIYVKGSRSNPSCSKAFVLSQNSTDLELKVESQQLIKCGFRAWPKPNSKMMLLSGQVIVAFHPTLVTPSDRAFRAHCEFEDFKQQAEIGVDNVFQEHDLILGNFELPEISMKVLPAGEESVSKNSLEPQELKVLKVGDPIIFEWKLQQEHGIFGIELERCSAETEDGKGMKIIENGCSLDEELISDTTSSADFSKIYANSLAFKFPEEHIVYIRCAIRTPRNHQWRRGRLVLGRKQLWILAEFGKPKKQKTVDENEQHENRHNLRERQIPNRKAPWLRAPPNRIHVITLNFLYARYCILRWIKYSSLVLCDYDIDYSSL